MKELFLFLLLVQSSMTGVYSGGALGPKAASMTFTKAVVLYPNVVLLMWQPSSSPNIKSYNIYRSTVSGKEKKIASVALKDLPTCPPQYLPGTATPAGSLCWTNKVTSAKKAVDFYYYVTAVNIPGVESKPSNETWATVPAKP